MNETSSSSLLRLSTVELGRVLAFLPPDDLYYAATSVCGALSQAAGASWELWHDAAEQDLQRAVLASIMEVGTPTARTVAQWQWNRVVLMRNFFRRISSCQRWDRVSEANAALFLRTGKVKLIRDVQFSPSECSALARLIPHTVLGRRQALLPDLQEAALDKVKEHRVNYPVALYFSSCGVAALFVVSPLLIMMYQSRVAVWGSEIKIGGINKLISVVRPWVDPYVALPFDQIVPCLMRHSAWRIDVLEKVDRFFSITIPLNTLRGLSPVEAQLLLLSLPAGSGDDAVQSWLGLNDSWIHTLVGSAGAAALNTPSLAAGLVSGVVAAVCRWKRRPVTHACRLHRTTHTAPDTESSLSLSSFVSAIGRWARPASLVLHVAWLRFAFAAAATMGDFVTLQTLSHAITIFDDVLRSATWAPNASTTFVSIVAVWAACNRSALHSFVMRAVNYAVTRRAADTTRRHRFDALRTATWRQFFGSFNALRCLVWAANISAGACAAAAAVRAIDPNALQRIGYGLMSSPSWSVVSGGSDATRPSSASSAVMTALAPMLRFTAAALPSLTDLLRLTSGAGPAPPAAVGTATIVPQYAEFRAYLDRTAITAFIASRVAALPLRAALVGVGSFLIERAATVLKTPPPVYQPPHRRTPGARWRSGQRAEAIAQVLQNGARFGAAMAPHIVAGLGAAWVASAEGQAALRCELRLSNVLFGALVFAAGTTAGDTLCSLALEHV